MPGDYKIMALISNFQKKDKKKGRVSSRVYWDLKSPACLRQVGSPILGPFYGPWSEIEYRQYVIMSRKEGSSTLKLIGRNSKYELSK